MGHVMPPDVLSELALICLRSLAFEVYHSDDKSHRRDTPYLRAAQTHPIYDGLLA